MLAYAVRRLLIAIPVLLCISFVIFALLTLAPNDPLGDLPLTIPPEVRASMRAALGLDQPFLVRFLLWLRQFFVNEPLNLLHALTGLDVGADRPRVLSWATRSPVVDLIAQRLPQTLWVVGLAYLFGVLLAIPLGALSAWRQHSWFDQLASFVAIVGYSTPTFFTGVVLIVLFSAKLQWFPSVYDTNLRVTDWPSFVAQVRQMALPVLVLTLYNTSQISRFVRAAMLDNLSQDYVRTARAKGVRERVVLVGHALRNSLIPVVTVVALGVPTIFSGAIVTEQVFRVNGLGQLLITAIQGGDLPLVQTLTFIFAVLIVAFNLIADLIYAALDPRIGYE